MAAMGETYFLFNACSNSLSTSMESNNNLNKHTL